MRKEEYQEAGLEFFESIEQLLNYRETSKLRKAHGK